MRSSNEFLNPSEAALSLGVSIKALRLYEQRGLLTPVRTAAGWRAYGPAEMSRAAEIAALRGLGFSLAQVARVLKGDVRGLEPVLSTHQAALEGRIRDLVATVGRVRDLREGLGRGQTLDAGDLAQLLAPTPNPPVAFDLPLPWGGERFELRRIQALTYITGPLGSGKTRLARCLADAIPGAAFLGLDADGPSALVVDMVEQGLDQATQEALIAHLRRRAPGERPLFLLTRSSAILDLDSVGADEAIIFCPANHAPPCRVAPHPGTPGYEALASCLASPDVRARSDGVVAVRPARLLAP